MNTIMAEFIGTMYAHTLCECPLAVNWLVRRKILLTNSNIGIPNASR